MPYTNEELAFLHRVQFPCGRALLTLPSIADIDRAATLVGTARNPGESDDAYYARVAETISLQKWMPSNRFAL